MSRLYDSETLLGTKQDEHGRCEQNLPASKLHCVLTSCGLGMKVSACLYMNIYFGLLV